MIAKSEMLTRGRAVGKRPGVQLPTRSPVVAVVALVRRPTSACAAAS
jgi:hypothetical protein